MYVYIFKENKLMIMILFHDFEDDRFSGLLNKALEKKGIHTLDTQNPVHVITTRDGSMIVCWDTDPTPPQLQVVQKG